MRGHRTIESGTEIWFLLFRHEVNLLGGHLGWRPSLLGCLVVKSTYSSFLFSLFSPPVRPFESILVSELVSTKGDGHRAEATVSE